MSFYLKTNKCIIPRRVEDLNDAPERPPQSAAPDQGSHWVGWFVVWEEELELETHYAVWQDYKKRGFYVQPRGESSHHVVAGSLLEQLVRGVEDVHNLRRRDSDV